MKDIMYFYLKSCPYCKECDRFLNELLEENEEYKKIKINRIEERANAEVADLFDYFYVPCFYVDGVKEHEGGINKEKLKAVLDKALA